MSKTGLRIFILTILSLCNLHSIGQQYNPYKISAIKAYLFYNSDFYKYGNSQISQNKKNRTLGTFSENIIDNKKFELYNVQEGEGGAKGISYQTLVIVEIPNILKKVRKEGDYLGNIQLQCFTIVDTGDAKIYSKVSQRITKIFDETHRFLISSYQDKYSAAFLLTNVGCQKLKLSAILSAFEFEPFTRGDKESRFIVKDKLNKIIDFQCGE